MKNALALFAALAIVAAIAPAPGSTDRGFYEQLGRELIIGDCSDIHCFRPLVPGIVEHLPGPSLFKWKAYAVVANAIAALAVGRFCMLIGLSWSASIAATWLAALGTGSLYSIFDPHTADPLMHMLGPLLAIELWQGRSNRAGWMAAIGLFAKEFAAAPLWIFTGFAALSRRWPAARHLLLVSTAVMIVWLVKVAGLMALLNYRFGFTASDDLLGGAYLATWLSRVGWSGALMYLFTTFGAVYVLLPAGFLRAGRDVRLLALATIPAVAAFLYVEQPERAHWNFHFVVIPVAVLALEGLPSWMIAAFVSASSVVGLRFGAQLEIRSIARVALVAAVVIAAVALVSAIRRRQNVAQPFRAAIAGLKPCATTIFWSLVGLESVALVFLTFLMLDIHSHRLVETVDGVNQFGFRGPIRTRPQPGVRIAVVGGSAAFEAGTAWWDTMAARLASELKDRRQPAWVDNWSEPAAGSRLYAATLRDYEYLNPDVICLFDGYDAVDEVPARGRRDSIVFRMTGYRPGSPSYSTPGIAPVLQDGPFNPVLDPSCSGASASYCLAMIDTVRFALARSRGVVVATPPYVSARHEVQQQSLAGALDREFGGEPRFRYKNLGTSDRSSVVSQLADGILDVIRTANPERRTNDEPRTANGERRPR